MILETQGSALAPTLFLIHINNILFATTNPIHSLADDNTPHSSTCSSKPSSLSEHDAKRQAKSESLNKDLYVVLECWIKDLVEFNAYPTKGTQIIS